MDSNNIDRNEFIESLKPFIMDIKASLSCIIDRCEGLGMFSKGAKKFIDDEYKSAINVLSDPKSSESERVEAWEQASILQKAKSFKDGDPFTNLLCESEKALYKVIKEFYSE